MITNIPSPFRFLCAAVLTAGLVTSQPVQAQTRQLTDEQIRTIEYHFKLDQFMVGGCLVGATFGAITGLMTLSGVSVVAAVPYISTGCSLGFLIGPATMLIRDFFSRPAAPPESTGWHLFQGTE